MKKNWNKKIKKSIKNNKQNKRTIKNEKTKKSKKNWNKLKNKLETTKNCKTKKNTKKKKWKFFSNLFIQDFGQQFNFLFDNFWQAVAQPYKINKMYDVSLFNKYKPKKNICNTNATKLEDYSIRTTKLKDHSDIYATSFLKLTF